MAAYPNAAGGDGSDIGACEATWMPPNIFIQPQNVTAAQGQSATFSVAVTGSEPLFHFQWRFNGTNLPGPHTNIYSYPDWTYCIYTVTNAQLANAGNYSAVVTNLYGSVTSSPAILTVTPPPKIGILVGGTNLVSSVSTVSFGTNQLGQTSAPVVFTVTNSGLGNLIPGPLNGGIGDYSEFVVDTSTMAYTVPPGGSTTFTVTFRPTSEGTRNATIYLWSNDADQSPFFIGLTGFVGSRLDPGFHPNADNAVYSVAVQADGKVLLGGAFHYVDGWSRNCLARVNAGGTLDTNFNPNAGDMVTSVAVQADGKILLGGGFTTVGGTARNYIARVNAGGTLDTNFHPDPNGGGLCRGGAGRREDSAGGQFHQRGGDRVQLHRPRQCRRHARHQLQPGREWLRQQRGGAGGREDSAGGQFTSVGGTMRNRVARVNADGSLDTSFDPDADKPVVCVAVQADGKILLGGSFTTVAGTA